MINFERSERKRVLNCIVCEFVFVNQIFLSAGRADYRGGKIKEHGYSSVTRRNFLPSLELPNTNTPIQIGRHKYKKHKYKQIHKYMTWMLIFHLEKLLSVVRTFKPNDHIDGQFLYLTESLIYLKHSNLLT